MLCPPSDEWPTRRSQRAPVDAPPTPPPKDHALEDAFDNLEGAPLIFTAHIAAATAPFV